MKKVWSLLGGLLIIAVAVMMLQDMMIPKVTISNDVGLILGIIGWVVVFIAVLDKKAESVDSLAIMVLTVVAILEACNRFNGKKILPNLTGDTRTWICTSAIIIGAMIIIAPWLRRWTHRD